MKTMKTILNLAAVAIFAAACGNTNKTPDINYAATGFGGGNQGGGNSGGSGLPAVNGGSGSLSQCTGAVNIQNTNPNSAAYSYSACRTAQGLSLKPAATNFNDAVCVFYAQNGNPLFNSNQGSFVYQCVTLTSAGQTLNAQGFNYNSIYVARSNNESARLASCFQMSASNPAISIMDCAAYYGISFAIGGL